MGIEVEAWVEGGELIWRLLEGWMESVAKLFSCVESKHCRVVTIHGVVCDMELRVLSQRVLYLLLLC